MEETTSAGEHEHCFCRKDTGGRIICCRCGQPLGGQVVNREIVLMWEQMGHKRDEIENENKMKQGDLL